MPSTLTLWREGGASGNGQRLPCQKRCGLDGTDLQFPGMNVGVIVHGLEDDERRKAYHADITYGTNNEFGFDYLRDNMKFTLDDYVQRDFFMPLLMKWTAS